MSNPPLVRRVEILEDRVEALTELPARVTAVEAGLVALREEVRASGEALREQIRAGDEETRRYMRVLHEDVISRIALLQEGVDRSNGDNGRAARARRPGRRRR